MAINRKLIERTIYIVLMTNIFVTLIVSSLILSFRGSEKNIVFFFENDPAFVSAVLVAFVVFYPMLFLITYLITFIIQFFTKKLFEESS
tara:strand:+ start:856 stop:1122 length:267 start_codon:yes stop_codon:yes gene_type:complete